METVEVAIIEDTKNYREILNLIVDGTDGFRCNQIYSNGNSAIEGIRGKQPNIVLVDLGLPDISGVECIDVLKSEFPAIQFLVISISDDEEKIFEALAAGAQGYLTKDTSHSKIIESIKELIEGGAPMSANIAKKVLGFFNVSTKDIAANYKKDLSPRETEVLELLVQGLSYKDIGERMYIDKQTVKSHCGNIYKKLHIKGGKDHLIRKVYHDDPLVFKLQEEVRRLKAEIKELKK